MDNLPRIDAKKSLGQHFLNNRKVPFDMAEAAQIATGDIVLEIGPGTGALTRELLSREATVVAIEADARAITSLETSFAREITAQKLILIHGDTREMDLQTISPLIRDHQYKVVANIPYYLSGMLFRTFLETDTQPTDLVFLVQREVAERIARDPKESILSLSVKVFGDPVYVKTVKKGNFSPPPKVDSAIIAVHHISKKRLETITESQFFEIIHTAFGAKRKQLLGNLTQLFDRGSLINTFSTVGLKEDVRGEDVPLATWLRLTDALSKLSRTR